MNIKTPAALAIAALLLTPSALLFAQSATTDASQEASKMVPAKVVFLSTIDSAKSTSGTQVKVKLQGKVSLENGPVLPSGTVLVGQIVDDATQSGKAKLALRFTEADLKNGQIVPIKATIFDVHTDTTENAVGSYNVSGMSLGWDKGTLGVNQSDAMPGIDLHSKIDSPNSGVFVSSKKDIKFSPAVQLELAIAPRSGSAEQSAYGY
jgi:hypothetical protein